MRILKHCHWVSVDLAYSKCSKILNRFHVLFSNKKLVFISGIHKMDVRIANRKTLIRLQSDLGLQFLSRLFWQATSV